jgi:hypothetical protein
MRELKLAFIGQAKKPRPFKKKKAPTALPVAYNNQVKACLDSETLRRQIFYEIPTFSTIWPPIGPV